MKFCIKLCVFVGVVAAACALASSGIFAWANVLHKFNWSYYLIFLAFSSFVSIAVTGALIFIAPWEREYEKNLTDGCSEKQSFELASGNVKRCPPKWLLQLYRRMPEIT